MSVYKPQVDEKVKEEWRKIDFIGFRKQQFAKLDQQLLQVDSIQNDRKGHNDEELEQVEYLENENLSIQKELVRAMETQRNALGDLEKENFDFLQKFQATANDKESLRGQICEIENIIRQLRHEIESTNVDSKRIQIIAEKEDELLNKKSVEEKRIVKLVGDDIKDQIKILEDQFGIAQNTQIKQESIEKQLKSQFEKAKRELDKLLQDSSKKREEQLIELQKIQQEVLKRKTENETIRSKNRELEFELERLENYTNQLKENIQDMMTDYRTQFQQLTQTIDENNKQLEALRKQLGDSQKTYFDLRTQNEILGQQVDSLKSKRDLNISLNEERRLRQLQINIDDAQRKTTFMEHEVEHIIERWHGKIEVVKKAIEEDQNRNQSKVLGELVDKYIQHIFDRNRKIVEVVRIKEEIESKINVNVNEDEIRNMKDELQNLIKQYDKLVGDKIVIFNDMISNLREITRNNEGIIKNDEEVARLKNTVEIVQIDINQKKRLLLDQRAVVDDLKQQMRDIDFELAEKEQKITESDENVKCKEGEIQDLEDMIKQKDKLIAQLQNELIDIEERKRREEEERRRREMEALLAKPEPRKWYIPVKGDAVDEMMAKYLNDCPYFVPVKRLGEGQYMYGSKKIFAKIMNGKLIIRVGGGYMLIDEFLKNFAEQEREKADVRGGLADLEDNDLNDSPPKKGGSPNRISKSPNGRKM